MKRHLLGMAVVAVLSVPAVAQSPMQGQMHGKGGGQMPMGGSMRSMPGDQMQQMREMMGMMREMMPMMQRMQRQGTTPERRAEMMKQMAPMMQAMMPMMQKMMGGADGQATPAPGGAGAAVDAHHPAAPQSAAIGASSATAAYEAAAMKMHTDMQTPYTGNADVDFAKGMIPHHEGAIAMANILLQYGKDPELRKFAEDVIKAQTGEIATLRDWLAKNSK